MKIGLIIGVNAENKWLGMTFLQARIFDGFGVDKVIQPRLLTQRTLRIIMGETVGSNTSMGPAVFVCWGK